MSANKKEQTLKTNDLKRQLLQKFYENNIGAFVLAICSSLFLGSLNIIVSWLIQQLTDTASGVVGARPLQELTYWTLIFIVMIVLGFMLDYWSQPCFIERALFQYKNFAFDQLLQKSIASFQEEETAAYLSALTQDATTIEEGYLSQQLQFIQLGIQFFGALGLMLYYSPQLTAIAFGLTIVPFIASMLTGNLLKTAEQKVAQANQTFTSMLSDSLGGFAVIKNFKAERELIRQFMLTNTTLKNKKLGKRRLQTMISLISNTTGIFAQLGVFIIGAYFALSGRGLTGGMLLAFVNLMNHLISPLTQLPLLISTRRAALGLIERLADLLTTERDNISQESVDELSKRIAIDNLSYSYDGEKDALKNITLTIDAGKSYAIVGGSGSGKSTLLNLLMGEATDYRGHIYYDHLELKQIKTDSLYQLISVIQQQVFIFNDTVRNNLTMYQPFNEEKMNEAIQHARLEQLVARHGLDGMCGENGRHLSGGEKQRISIARSLLKESSVLFADEATSSLDAQTAYQITDDLLNLKGMTRVIVTHALEESLLRQYDQIFVLKDGRLEETGTFSELMTNDGYFKALYTIAQ